MDRSGEWGVERVKRRVERKVEECSGECRAWSGGVLRVECGVKCGE